MKSEKSMNQLAQGDVDSGKTVFEMLALFKAAKNEILSINNGIDFN